MAGGNGRSGAGSSDNRGGKEAEVDFVANEIISALRLGV